MKKIFLTVITVFAAVFTSALFINDVKQVDYQNNKMSTTQNVEPYIDEHSFLVGPHGTNIFDVKNGKSHDFYIRNLNRYYDMTYDSDLEDYYAVNITVYVTWDDEEQQTDTFETLGEATGTELHFRIEGNEINIYGGEGDSIVDFNDRPVHSIQIGFPTPLRKPAISGEAVVINNIDSPFSLERIQEIAELAAFDAHYGDLTDLIEIVTENYSDNMKVVGDFEIEYRVENPFGLSTNFILLVANKDLTAPVITGPGTSTISYSEEFVLSNLLAKFTVTDNYYENIKIELESTTHVPGKPGVYQFKLKATDGSKNIGRFTHTLTVVDDVLPNITDTNEGVIEVNWRDKVSDATLLLGLSARDAIDGELTDSIRIVENNLKQVVGTYTVKYEVSDKAGNTAKYTRTYRVITTDAPIFWVSANLLLISEVDKLSNDQLAAELSRYEKINMASYSFIQNKYENNENTPGNYTVRLAIADVNGDEHIVERTIQVFAADDLPEVELTIWQKIKGFFSNVWSAIKTFFGWIWSAVQFIWKYTFGLLFNLLKGLFTKNALMFFLSL